MPPSSQWPDNKEWHWTILAILPKIFLDNIFLVLVVLALYLSHRKSDFCVCKTAIETMEVINWGKYKYQLRNDKLLFPSYDRNWAKCIQHLILILVWDFEENININWEMINCCSLCHFVSRIRICDCWINYGWKFIDRVTFYILSWSKLGYRDRDLLGLKVFMNMSIGAFTHFIFMRQAHPTPIHTQLQVQLKKSKITHLAIWLTLFLNLQNLVCL